MAVLAVDLQKWPLNKKSLIAEDFQSAIIVEESHLAGLIGLSIIQPVELVVV